MSSDMLGEQGLWVFRGCHWKISNSFSCAQVFIVFHLQKKSKPGFYKQLVTHSFLEDLAKKF